MNPKHPKSTNNWYQNNKDPLPLLPCITYPAHIHGKSRAYWCDNKNEIKISRSEFREKNGQNKVNNNNFPVIYTFCTTFKIKGLCPKLWIKAKHDENIEITSILYAIMLFAKNMTKNKDLRRSEPTHAIWDNSYPFSGLSLQSITRGTGSLHKCFFAFVHEVIVCRKLESSPRWSSQFPINLSEAEIFTTS